MTEKLQEYFGADVSVLHHDSYYKRHDELPFEKRRLLNYDHHSIHKIFSPPVFSYSIIFRQASQRLGPDFLCETAKNSRLPGADMVQCE